MSQIHKRFTQEQVKELLERYLKKQIKRNYIQEILGIKRRRFLCLRGNIKKILRTSQSNMKEILLPAYPVNFHCKIVQFFHEN